MPSATLSEQLWGNKPFGADQVAIIFSEPQCVGYQFPNAQIVRNCTGNGIVVAVHVSAADSTGKQYTLIAGRAFNSKVTAVAAELDSAENTPMSVTGGGFAVVLPGTRRLIALVPIDQFGNLVGERYVIK